MSEPTLDYKINALGQAVKSLIDKANQTVRTKGSSTNFYSEKGGQFQFSLISPKYVLQEKNGIVSRLVERDGAVLIEAAPPDPDKQGFLDWKNRKITFSLSDKDIGDIVYSLEKGILNKNGELVCIYHKNQKGEIETSKVFKIKPGNQNSQGQTTFLVEIYDATNKNKVSVFIIGSDLMRLKLALESAFPLVLGWTE